MALGCPILGRGGNRSSRRINLEAQEISTTRTQLTCNTYNIHLTWFRGGETEEVGQGGRNASWVRVSNCARDFIDSMAVVE